MYGLETDSVHRYDPSIGEWEEIPSMCYSRQYAAGAVLGRKIYLIGGDTSNTIRACQSCEVFDPKLGSWQEVGSTKTPRYASAA